MCKLAREERRLMTAKEIAEQKKIDDKIAFIHTFALENGVGRFWRTA